MGVAEDDLVAVINIRFPLVDSLKGNFRYVFAI